MVDRDGIKKYGLGVLPAIHPASKPAPEAPPIAPPAPPEESGWSWELPAIIALVLLSVLLVFLKKRQGVAR